jgi:hypothetical protein
MKRTPSRQRRQRPEKPAKPSPDFLLYAHATKRWAKKVRGKTCHRGRDREGCGRHIPDGQETPAPRGELTAGAFRDYYRTCAAVVKAFDANRVMSDLRADDFEALRAGLAKGRNPTTPSCEVQRIGSVCAQPLCSPCRNSPRYAITRCREPRPALPRRSLEVVLDGLSKVIRGPKALTPPESPPAR